MHVCLRALTDGKFYLKRHFITRVYIVFLRQFNPLFLDTFKWCCQLNAHKCFVMFDISRIYFGYVFYSSTKKVFPEVFQIRNFNRKNLGKCEFQKH